MTYKYTPETCPVTVLGAFATAQHFFPYVNGEQQHTCRDCGLQEIQMLDGSWVTPNGRS